MNWYWLSMWAVIQNLTSNDWMLGSGHKTKYNIKYQIRIQLEWRYSDFTSEIIEIFQYYTRYIADVPNKIEKKIIGIIEKKIAYGFICFLRVKVFSFCNLMISMTAESNIDTTPRHWLLLVHEIAAITQLNRFSNRTVDNGPYVIVAIVF